MRAAPACSDRPGRRDSGRPDRAEGSASGASAITIVGPEGAAGVRQREARALVTDLELELAHLPREHRRPVVEAFLGARTACGQIDDPSLARDRAGGCDDQHVAVGHSVVETAPADARRAWSTSRSARTMIRREHVRLECIRAPWQAIGRLVGMSQSLSLDVRGAGKAPDRALLPSSGVGKSPLTPRLPAAQRGLRCWRHDQSRASRSRCGHRGRRRRPRGPACRRDASPQWP